MTQPCGRNWPKLNRFGFGMCIVDDGDPHVYIKTTWATIAATGLVLIALGAWLF